MDLNNMTLGELKEIQSVLGQNKTMKTPMKIGEQYFIRTVTMYYVGRLKEIVGQYLILEKASWVCDTGRFHNFLKEGKCNEYEGFVEDLFVPSGSIVDITKWPHKLFEGQK